MRKFNFIFCSVVLILAVWQLFYLFNNQNFLLPAPTEVFVTFYQEVMGGALLIHLVNSLFRVFVGFGIASFLGVSLALLLGYFEKFGKYFKPIIEILRPIPPIAWIPIAILWFGLGNMSAFFIVFLGALFPVFTNAYFGITSLPVIYRNVAATFELGKRKFIFKILLPFSLPYIFTGMRIGMGMAWMSVIAAELIGAQSGIGYYIQMSRLLLQIDKVIVGMIVIGVCGYLLVAFIDILESLFIPWNKKKYARITKNKF